MHYKAVIFDMDGTLVDSIEADFLAWQRLFAFYEIPLTFEDYIPLLGIKSAQVAKEFLPIKNDEELAIALANKLVYFEEIISEKGILPIPFADVFLKQVKQFNVQVALATSSRKVKMEMVMKKLDLLHFFDVIITAEDVKKGKPEPEIFIKTAKKLCLPREECIVFEDALNGVKAAKNAGMKCVALSSRRTLGLLAEADIVIDSFEDLDFSQICRELENISFK